jgi:hypothetical protein
MQRRETAFRMATPCAGSPTPPLSRLMPNTITGPGFSPFCTLSTSKELQRLLVCTKTVLHGPGPRAFALLARKGSCAGSFMTHCTFQHLGMDEYITERGACHPNSGVVRAAGVPPPRFGPLRGCAPFLDHPGDEGQRRCPGIFRPTDASLAYPQRF